MNHKYLLSTLLISTALFTLKSQTLDDARSWYLEGRYEEALPIIQRAYQDDSTQAALNQWLGVSLLKTGKILEAEQYLNYAENNKIPRHHSTLVSCLVSSTALKTLRWRLKDSRKQTVATKRHSQSSTVSAKRQNNCAEEFSAPKMCRSLIALYCPKRSSSMLFN